MNKKYPDVSELFKMKDEWRRRQAERPIEEKLRVAKRLKQLSEKIAKSPARKTKKFKYDRETTLSFQLRRS